MIWFKKNKEKKELQQLFDIAEDEKITRFSVWNNMLYAKSKIAILEAQTAEEISLKWDNFLLHNHTGDGRLGSIWSVDKKNHYIQNGLHYLKIEYKQFSLRDGFDLDAYEKAIEEYELSKNKLVKLEEKLKTFNL